MGVGNGEHSESWLVLEGGADLAELRSGNCSACLEIVTLVAACLGTVVSVAVLQDVADFVTAS